MEKIRIGGIMQNAHLSLLNVTAVPDRPGIAAAILGELGRRGINVQFIVQCIDQNKQDQVAVCVDRDDGPSALGVVNLVAPDVEAGQRDSYPEVAIVSIFGPDFRERQALREPCSTRWRRGRQYPGDQYVHLDSFVCHRVGCLGDCPELAAGYLRLALVGMYPTDVLKRDTRGVALCCCRSYLSLVVDVWESLIAQND